MASRLTTILSGVAGEYFVAAELSRRGYVASITLRNTRGIDILASNEDATRTVGIQVKTRQTDGREWVLNKKAEELPDDVGRQTLFYIFVALNALGTPSYHVVPQSVVAEFVRTSHSNWLATPGRKGQAHVDNAMRKYVDAKDEYRDAWHLLGLDPREE